MWGGYAVAHFGHFVAEQSTRLLRSSTAERDLKLLLVLPPRATTGPPGWLLSVLEWYGFAQERVHFVSDRPVIVDELHVYPQEEHLTSRPSSSYLELLTDHSNVHLKRNGGEIPATYVSRAGMPSSGLGGELYIERALSQCGVKIVRPETLKLQEQLDVYARTRLLIFAEGSAVHGRQLLGRLDQRIAILVRRKGGRFAGRMISPRCSAVEYLDAISCSIHFSFDQRTGLPKRWEAFPMSVGGDVIDEFDRVGIDLRPYWSAKAFEAQLALDLDTWATRICRGNGGTDVKERIRLMEGSLYSVGLDRHASRLAEIAISVDADKADSASPPSSRP